MSVYLEKVERLKYLKKMYLNNNTHEAIKKEIYELDRELKDIEKALSRSTSGGGNYEKRLFQ